MPTWSSPRSERLGTPNPPAIRFARGNFGASSWFTHLLRPVWLLAPPVWIRLNAYPRGLLLPGFQWIGRPSHAARGRYSYATVGAAARPARPTGSANPTR